MFFILFLLTEGGGKKYDGPRESGDYKREGGDYNRSDRNMPTGPPYKAYVGNLPAYTVQSDLTTIFSQNAVFKNVKV